MEHSEAGACDDVAVGEPFQTSHDFFLRVHLTEFPDLLVAVQHVDFIKKTHGKPLHRLTAVHGSDLFELHARRIKGCNGAHADFTKRS